MEKYKHRKSWGFAGFLLSCMDAIPEIRICDKYTISTPLKVVVTHECLFMPITYSNKYLLSPHYLPGTFLGTRVTSMNQTDKMFCPHKTYYFDLLFLFLLPVLFFLYLVENIKLWIGRLCSVLVLTLITYAISTSISRLRCPLCRSWRRKQPSWSNGEPLSTDGHGQQFNGNRNIQFRVQ